MRSLFEHHRTPVAVDAISGACMMARREVIEQVQGFTTDYFMYAEDLDLCLKVKNAGWNVYYVPDAVVVHHGGRSSDSRPESNYAAIMIRESMYQFMRAHRGPLYAWAFRLAITVVTVCRVFCIGVVLAAASVLRRGSAFYRMWDKWTRILLWCVGLQMWTQRERSALSPVSPAVGASERQPIVD